MDLEKFRDPAPQVQDIGANDENWAPNSAVVDDASGTGNGTGDQGGTFTITPDADVTNVTASYTPAPGFTSGVETWVYRVTDAVSSEMDTATVTVTVTPADAQPVANDLSGVTIDTRGVSPSDASIDIDVGPGGDIPGNELGITPSTPGDSIVTETPGSPGSVPVTEPSPSRSIHTKPPTLVKMVPDTSNTTVLGPDASTAARKDPAPLSLRLVT